MAGELDLDLVFGIDAGVVLTENFQYLRPREFRGHRIAIGEPFAQFGP